MMTPAMLERLGVTTGVRVEVTTRSGARHNGKLGELVGHYTDGTVAVEALLVDTGTGRHLIPWQAVDSITTSPTATHPAST